MLSFPCPESNPPTTTDLSSLVTAHGTCVDAPDPDAWFPHEPNPTGGLSPESLATRRAAYEDVARELCADCPVRAQCLELALREEYDLPRTWFHGIRGGKAPWQRCAMVYNRRRRARQAARPAAASGAEAVA
ncbi:WhiB family transcriptional regulator [Planomonospora parontospora]|nr:WhiB family transcriptional regulator [Planomonospora parontospora]